MADTADPVTSYRDGVKKDCRMAKLRADTVKERRFERRLHDVITVLMLLIAFPFGFALFALAAVFGRNLARAMAATVFMAAVHLTAAVNVLVAGADVGGQLSQGGLLNLIVEIARAQA